MPRKKFMSTLLPSVSDRPFVSNGMAVTPPVPVEAAEPGPVRLKRISMVKTETPRLGAGPKVTWSFAPSNCSAT
jgi:hypothetical protein